jgi:hypothetical protein
MNRSGCALQRQTVKRIVWNSLHRWRPLAPTIPGGKMLHLILAFVLNIASAQGFTGFVDVPQTPGTFVRVYAPGLIINTHQTCGHAAGASLKTDVETAAVSMSTDYVADETGCYLLQFMGDAGEVIAMKINGVAYNFVVSAQ